MPKRKEIEKLKAANAKLGYEISELKRSNDLLTAEKRILDEILDNLPGTFYIWDDRPQLIRRNKRHDEITGYSADDYVNMLPTVTVQFPPKYFYPAIGEGATPFLPRAIV